jgi:hypothetical protein
MATLQSRPQDACSVGRPRGVALADPISSRPAASSSAGSDLVRRRVAILVMLQREPGRPRQGGTGPILDEKNC